MSTLKELGTFLARDEAGWLVPATRDRAVQPEWRALVKTAAADCRLGIGVGYHSTYVRGSVATGLAVVGSSDLDLVVLVDDDEGERRPDWQAALGRELHGLHPIFTDLEVVVLGQGALRAAAARPEAVDPVTAQWRFLLALFGRCLDGPDLIPELGRFQPGPGVAYVMKALPPDLATFERRRAALDAEPRPAVRAAGSRRLNTWTAKKLLRSAAELAMLQDGRFTRDLSLAARRAAARFPELAETATALLRLAVFPPGDLAALGAWVPEVEPVLTAAATAAGLALEARVPRDG